MLINFSFQIFKDAYIKLLIADFLQCTVQIFQPVLKSLKQQVRSFYLGFIFYLDFPYHLLSEFLESLERVEQPMPPGQILQFLFFSYTRQLECFQFIEGISFYFQIFQILFSQQKLFDKHLQAFMRKLNPLVEIRQFYFSDIQQ